MPTVYRVEDSSQKRAHGLDRSLAGVVTFDGKDHGQVMPGEYLGLLLNEKIVPLPHPSEWSTLRAHRETFLSASLKGILLRVQRRICIACGNIFDAPRVTFDPSAGCLPGMIISLSVFVYYLFIRGAQFRAAVGPALLVMSLTPLVVSLVGYIYVRLAFAKQQQRIAQRCCPACGGLHSRSVENCAGKSIAIGGGERQVTVTIAGKS